MRPCGSGGEKKSMRRENDRINTEGKIENIKRHYIKKFAAAVPWHLALQIVVVVSASQSSSPVSQWR